MVRELEADTSQDTRLVLAARGARGAEALERGALRGGVAGGRR